MEKVEIRPMEEKHLSKVAEIWQDGFSGEPYNYKVSTDEIEDMIRKRFDRAHKPSCLVAMKENEVVGFIMSRILDEKSLAEYDNEDIGLQKKLEGKKVGHGQTLAVLSGHTGGGIGTRLLKGTISNLEKYVDAIVFDTHPENRKALEIYKGMGFVPMGRKRIGRRKFESVILLKMKEQS